MLGELPGLWRPQGPKARGRGDLHESGILFPLSAAVRAALVMKFVLLTRDAELREAAAAGFHPSDEFVSFEDVQEALDACESADLLFVDLLATLEEPHKIWGYERFAESKMGHPTAMGVPLVLISPPEDYELDFIVGWPDFVFANIRRPVTEKIFRRASTWV
jgi:hypothetical protein